jgi:hypothetical protein
VIERERREKDGAVAKKGFSRGGFAGGHGVVGQGCQEIGGGGRGGAMFFLAVMRGWGAGFFAARGLGQRNKDGLHVALAMADETDAAVGADQACEAAKELALALCRMVGDVMEHIGQSKQFGGIPHFDRSAWL